MSISPLILVSTKRLLQRHREFEFRLKKTKAPKDFPQTRPTFAPTLVALRLPVSRRTSMNTPPTYIIALHSLATVAASLTAIAEGARRTPWGSLKNTVRLILQDAGSAQALTSCIFQHHTKDGGLIRQPALTLSLHFTRAFFRQPLPLPENALNCHWRAADCIVYNRAEVV